MAQLHEIKPRHYTKKPKRVGRGNASGHGTYSGRGIKGQKARAGRKLQPIVRYILKKYHKLRGYRFSAKEKPQIVNLGVIDKKFGENEKVSPETLVEKGLARKRGGRLPKIKILAKGEISKPLNFENILVSSTAREKIEKAGGKVISS